MQNNPERISRSAAVSILALGLTLRQSRGWVERITRKLIRLRPHLHFGPQGKPGLDVLTWWLGWQVDRGWSCLKVERYIDHRLAEAEASSGRWGRVEG